MTSLSPPWALPPDRPTLEAGDIHVWRLSLHNAASRADGLSQLLAGDEISRAQSFHFPRDHDRFVVVRAVLRILLGMYLRISPLEIAFQYGARGKPALASNHSKNILHFNVAHSHELALLAFRQEGEVGVDLEHIRPEVVRERIAEQFFSRQEAATLRALPEDRQPAAFFNCWTRKEAFIKATGEGLSRPLDQFSVSLAPGEPAGLLDIQGDLQEPSKWLIHQLDGGGDYAAALAVQKPVRQIYCWEYEIQ
jgi:4'-phosphopantetheinyl transferase